MARLSRTESKKQQTRVAPEEDPEFQIAPLIDILLVLLVFFMSISSTEMLQVSKDIQLPVAKNADKPKENPSQAIVNVVWKTEQRQGWVVLDDVAYHDNADDMNALATVLNKRLMNNAEMRVLVRADRNVEYSLLRKVLEAVGRAEVPNVTFSAIDKEMQETPPTAPQI
jgi:biopolymer transport protein ExbD